MAEAEAIGKVLARRSDLSTFVVHLTKEHAGQSASDNLKAILAAKKLLRGDPRGVALKPLRAASASQASQRVVCFSETPLEHVSLMTKKIEKRAVELAPYGVAITKKQARARGAHPIWYVDSTGQTDNRVIDAVRKLVDEGIASGSFDSCAIAQISPFVEIMFTWTNPDGTKQTNEWWWEREWRIADDFTLPKRLIGICPEAEIETMESAASAAGLVARFVDSEWSLEQIIGRLAGFEPEELELP